MKKRVATGFALILISLFFLSGLTAGCSGSTLVSGDAQLKSTPDSSTNTQDDKSNIDSISTSDNSTTYENTNQDTDKDGNIEEETGSSNPTEPEEQKIKVKALYLTGWTVGNPAKLEHYIDLANKTEINSYVVDIKDDDGYVGYESNVPAVREIGAWQRKYDADTVLKKFHENNIHVIGRIVCFKDPYLSIEETDMAVKNVNGGLWTEKNSDGKEVTWLNAYNRDSWSYMIEIAKEAVEKGFDEIQFDYVRFPSGDKKIMDFGKNEKSKYETINDFLAYARKEMPGVVLSADVFGIILESPGDREDIGQNLEYVGKDMDYISPMVYPSHYALGQVVNKVKFVKPDLEPYAVVYNSLIKAKDRISKVDGYKADVRPYLQDFTASWIGKGNFQEYGPQQMKEQIKAVYDAGYDEWIFWDAKNTYDEAAFANEN